MMSPNEYKHLHTTPSFQEYGTVYPGHPVVTAAFILHHYQDDISKAFERNDAGFMKAAGDQRIPGAGDAVYAGLDLIRYVQDGLMTIDQAIEYGIQEWTRLRNQGGYKDRTIPGNIEACVYAPKFREYAEKCIVVRKKE